MKTPALTVSLALVVLLSTACSSQIQHGLDEVEANEIQTILLEAGFDVRKIPEAGKKPSWAIEVDGDQAAAATRVLAELGLPRERLKGFDGLQTGLVATPTQERTGQLAALSEELATTLQSVAGVTMARVHLVVPEPPRPGQPPGRAKASAFIRARPGFGPRLRGMDEELRKLVSGSVEGLNPEDVSLVVNEVVSQVQKPVPGMSVAQKLRWLVVGLGVLVSTLALLVVFLSLRMRALRAAADEAKAAPAAPSRPVVNAASARKAA